MEKDLFNASIQNWTCTKFMVNKTQLILATIGLFSLVLRYPQIPNMAGSDSMVFFGYCVNLIEAGNFTWYISGLSYFELYPFSEGGGLFSIISSISLVTGLDLYLAIILVSLISGIFSTLISFICSYLLFKDKMVSILCSLFYISSHAVIFGSGWEISQRGYFSMFIPFLLFLIIRYVNTREIKFVPLIFLSILCSISIHSMHFINFLTFITIIASVLISKYAINPYFIKIRTRISLSIFIISVFLLQISFNPFAFLSNNNFETPLLICLSLIAQFHLLLIG